MALVGMSKETGKALSASEHLRQSILDILTTPRGSRCLNRDYGSDLYKMIDGTIDPLLISYEVADSLSRHEPRLKLKNVRVDAKGGRVQVVLDGEFLGQKIGGLGLEI